MMKRAYHTTNIHDGIKLRVEHDRTNEKCSSIDDDSPCFYVTRGKISFDHSVKSDTFNQVYQLQNFKKARK